MIYWNEEQLKTLYNMGYGKEIFTNGTFISKTKEDEDYVTLEEYIGHMYFTRNKEAIINEDFDINEEGLKEAYSYYINNVKRTH